MDLATTTVPEIAAMEDANEVATKDCELERMESDHRRVAMNSRAKGQRGEREWIAELERAGFVACRSDQSRGGYDTPDVECPGLDRFHMEVTRTEKLNLYTKVGQAIADCAGRVPVVAHRRNHAPWLVTLRAEDFLALVRETTERAT